MAEGRDDSLQSISVQLVGKNYTYWSYVMKNFLKGKKLWGYVSGTFVKPRDEKVENYMKLVDVWESDNSKIITWINNSVKHKQFPQQRPPFIHPPSQQHQQQWSLRPPNPNAAMATPSLDPSMLEQFQKFLAAQPHAMSVSSLIGLSSSCSSGTSPILWVLDSGASHHMSPDLSSFVSLSHYSSVSVLTADGTPMPLAGCGSIVTPCLSLPDVYYIPKLTINLVSVSQLCESGYLVFFFFFRLLCAGPAIPEVDWDRP